MTADLDANKDLVRHFYAEAINARDLDAVDRLLTDDFTHDGGDLVAAHQRWSGTHTGEIVGVPATGTAVSFTSTAIVRVADGLIAEAWDETDLAGLTTQLQQPAS